MLIVCCVSLRMRVTVLWPTHQTNRLVLPQLGKKIKRRKHLITEESLCVTLFFTDDLENCLLLKYVVCLIFTFPAPIKSVFFKNQEN